jgi:hypothetical protein
MTKKIFLEYENGVRAVATLFEDLAPRTCEAMWGALEKPVTMQTMHAMYAGPEVMMGLPEEAQNFDPEAVPAENQQVVPAPGDLQWYWQRLLRSWCPYSRPARMDPRQHLGRHHRRTRGVRSGERRDPHRRSEAAHHRTRRLTVPSPVLDPSRRSSA